MVAQILKSVPQGFAYNSGSNPYFSVEQIRDLIREHVDINFQPC